VTELMDINFLLARMVELLRFGGIDAWADSLERSRKKLTKNIELEKNTILSMFGGMGSLSDLVLYRDGKPLVKENNEFDELRKKLYAICRG